MISSWTQDGATKEHTIVIHDGPTTGSNDPNAFGYRIIPLIATDGQPIGVNELSNFVAWIEMTSGMTDLDLSVLYVGLMQGPAITDDRIWMRLSGLQSGKPRVLRAGRNSTIVPAVPAAGDCVFARQDLLTEPATTVGALRVTETVCMGLDASKVVIASSDQGLAGLTTDMTLAPHVIIAAGAFNAPSEVTLTFKIHLEARRLPGGVFPG